MFKNIKFISLFLGLFFFYSTAHADSNQDNDAQLDVIRQSIRAAIVGPDRISLIDQATIEIPEEYLYIPTKEASDFMHAIGNKTGESFIGLILPKDAPDWFITIDFIQSGYVRDNEAKEWNADDLLKSLKDGTEEANKERIQNGFPPIHVMGWIEKPVYMATDHRLVWGMRAKSDESSETMVNYNTYALGRDGFFEFNLITPESNIAHDKLHVEKILGALNFNNGKSYADFVEGKDKVAAYGIAALVTGIVAKKLGLIALIGVFFMKIWKLLILIPVLLGSKIKSLFRRNKKSIPE